MQIETLDIETLSELITSATEGHDSGSIKLWKLPDGDVVILSSGASEGVLMRPDG